MSNRGQRGKITSKKRAYPIFFESNYAYNSQQGRTCPSAGMNADASGRKNAAQ